MIKYSNGSNLEKVFILIHSLSWRKINHKKRETANHKLYAHSGSREKSMLAAAQFGLSFRTAQDPVRK